MIHSFWSSVAVVAGVLVGAGNALPADHQIFNTSVVRLHVNDFELPESPELDGVGAGNAPPADQQKLYTSVDVAPVVNGSGLFLSPELDGVPFPADAEKLLYSEVELATGGEPQGAAVDTTRARVFGNLFEGAEWNVCNNFLNGTADGTCRETKMSLDTTSEAGLTVMVIRDHYSVCKDNPSYVFYAELQNEDGGSIDSKLETIDPCLYGGISMRFENYGTANTVVVREYHIRSPPSETATVVTLFPLNILEEPTKTSDESWGDAWSHVLSEKNVSWMENLTQTVDLVGDAGFTEAYLDKIPAIFLHHWTTHLYCSKNVSDGEVQPDTDLIITLLDEKGRFLGIASSSSGHSLIELGHLCSIENLLPAAVVLDDYPRGTRYIQLEKRNRVTDVKFDNFYVGIEPEHVFNSSTDQESDDHDRRQLKETIVGTNCMTNVKCGSLNENACLVSQECGKEDYLDLLKRKAFNKKLWYSSLYFGGLITTCRWGVPLVGLALLVEPAVAVLLQPTLPELLVCMSQGIGGIGAIVYSRSFRQPKDEEVYHCENKLTVNTATGKCING